MNESIENINGRLDELEELAKYIESNDVDKEGILMYIAFRAITLGMDMDITLNEMTGKLEKKAGDNHE